MEIRALVGSANLAPPAVSEAGPLFDLLNPKGFHVLQAHRPGLRFPVLQEGIEENHTSVPVA